MKVALTGVCRLLSWADVRRGQGDVQVYGWLRVGVGETAGGEVHQRPTTDGHDG